MTPAESLRPQMDRIQQRSLIVGVIGLVLCCIGFALDRTQFLRSYLYGYLFWTGMTFGCLGILLMHNTVGGKWGIVIRKFLETGSSVRQFVMMGLLFIPILLGIGILFPWARPEALHDPIIQKKAGYLNVPFFIVRAILYFAIFILYAFILNRHSRRQDETADPHIPVRLRQISAPGLIVFTLCGTYAFFDWIMSLEPHWYSTIYGCMFLVGEMLEAFAFIIAIFILFSKVAPIRDYVTPQHFHDLGNMLFAFMILWTYLSLSQFIIIWSGNLPEEISWYLRRFHGGFGSVVIFVSIFSFFLPFVLLLMRPVKRKPALLAKVCLLFLVVRAVDVYWIVAPGFFPSGIHLNWMDFATLFGLGGIWIAAFMAQLKNKPLLPFRDPRLIGAPRETVTM
ncbi:MAG TPA: hypothetical protein VKV15_11390 [Bryobacteraceae bacterium]|nr:hypothetical protein [Bryobacteraceae bacterium]